MNLIFLCLEINDLISLKLLKSFSADGSTYWQCRDCEYRSSHKATIKRHVESKHIEATYQCDICHHQVSTKHQLNSHRSQKHGSKCLPYQWHTPWNVHISYICTEYIDSKMVRRTDGKWECLDCGYNTAHSTTIKRHVESKHFRNLYECDICQYQATTRNTLNIHKARLHNFVI